MIEYQYINGVRVPIQNEQKSELELLNTDKNSIDKIGFVTNHKTNAVQNSIMAGFVNGINTGYSISDKDAKFAKEYGISIGMYDNRYSLERKIAQTQSGWEQFGRSISQIAVNEVMLGTLLGFSDLYDWFANLGKAYGEDDWNNDFGRVLTAAQDKLKEDLAIYRENPDKSFDVKDAGWWWDNFVTIGSTASLLIPSLTITKGLSLAGKGLKLATNGTKIDRLLHKSGRFLGKAAQKVGVKNPYTIANNLSKFTKSAVPAVISRQMEDMLEGRETYKQTYEQAMQQFSTMTDEERTEFYERNKGIVYDENGNLKSDEDIAKYIADKAATYTFVNDFKYIGFDFLQFNSILRFGKRPITRSISEAQNKILDNFAHATERAAENVIEKSGRKGILKDALKFYAKNPRIALKQIATHSEFTEGLEEMGQGITQDNALAEYEKFFNPNYTNRTLESQLADPKLWEQGFWGMLGGIVFQGAGRGIEKVGKYIYKKYKGDKLSKEDLAKLESDEESFIQNHINSCGTNLETFKNKFELWRQGYNPQDKKYDIETKKEIKNDYTTTDGLRKMDENEKGMVLEDIINELMINLAASEVEIGNGDLVESFITDERFSKYIKNLNNDDTYTTNLYDKILNKYKETKELYYDNINRVFGSIDIDSEYFGKALALQLTRNSLYLRNVNDEINRIDSEIDKLRTNDNNNLIDIYHDGNILLETEKQLDTIIETLNDLKTKKENKEINDTFYNARIKELEKIVDGLLLQRKNPKFIKDKENPFIFSTLKFNEKEFSNDDEGNPIERDIEINFINDYNDFVKNRNNVKNRDIIKDIENKVVKFKEASDIETKAIEKLQKDAGTPIDAIKELIEDKVQQELQRSIKESEEIDSQEELQEAYDDFFATAQDFTNNRLTNARNNIIKWITDQETPSEAFESLMNKTAPKNIQEQFDLFKIGSEFYSYHTTLFQLAAQVQQKKNDTAVDTIESQNNNEQEEKINDVENKKENDEKPDNNVPSTGEVNEKNNLPGEVEQSFKEEEERAQKGQIVQDNISKRDIIRISIDNKLLETFSKLSNEEKAELRENGVNSKTYNEKIIPELQAYANELRKNEIISDSELENIINTSLAMYINSILEYIQNVEVKAKYAKFVSDLLKLNVRSAKTNLISEEDEEKIINASSEELIKKYIETINGQNIDGKPFINVDSLFEHLLDVYGRDVRYLINPILLHLQQNVNKYSINDINLIKRYIKHPKELIQRLASIKVKKDILGQRDTQYGNTAWFHAQIPTLAQEGQRLLSGKKVEIPKWDNTIEVWFTRYGTKTINNANERRAKAIQSYNNYITAVNYYMTHSDCKIYAYDTAGSISYRIVPNVEGVSIEDIGKDDYKHLEVGFVAKVDAIKENGKQENNRYKRSHTAISTGLFFDLTKTSDGIISNFDKYLLPIIKQEGENATKIYELLTDFDKTTYTEEELKLLENYFKDADIVYKNKFTEFNNEKANELIKQYLYPILIDAPIRLNQDFIESYTKLREKIYDNYSKTYELQSRFKEKKYTEMKMDVEETITIKRDEKERDVTVSEFSRENGNKLAYVDENGKIRLENEEGEFDNPAAFNANSLGIVLHNSNGKPIIAWVQTRNYLSDNNKLYNSVANTIKTAIKTYFEGGRTKEKASEFYNYIKNLIQNNESPFYIEEQNTPNSAFKIFNNKIYGIEDEILLYSKENENDSKTLLDKIVNELCNKLVFNTSIPLLNKTIQNNNKFVEFKDGKMILHLDKDYTYTDYFDFVTKEKAFKIDESLENPFDNLEEFSTRNVFFKAIEETNSPVKGEDIAPSYDKLVKAITVATKKKSFDVEKALKAIGISKQDINILLGKTSGITFIDNKAYYDGNDEKGNKAYYNTENKKLYFTQNFISQVNDKNFVRLLIHENLHKKFDELSENDRKIVLSNLKKIYKAALQELYNDLDSKDITKEHRSFIIDLSEIFILPNEEYKKSLKIGNKEDTEEEKRKKYEQYVSYIKQRLLSMIDSINDNSIDDDKVEEFLMESMSQKAIIKYLDSKEYKEEQFVIEDETEENRTLWQKIVDLIIKFFTNVYDNFKINDVKNNNNASIFANEYRLLSNIGREEKVETPIVVENNKNSNEEGNLSNEQNKGNGQESNNQNDNDISVDDMNELDYNIMDDSDDQVDIGIIQDDDIKSAKTDYIEDELYVRSIVAENSDNVDISRTIQAKDMTAFAKMFGISKQAEISSMIKNGAFEFACK